MPFDFNKSNFTACSGAQWFAAVSQDIMWHAMYVLKTQTTFKKEITRQLNILKVKQVYGLY